MKLTTVALQLPAGSCSHMMCSTGFSVVAARQRHPCNLLVATNGCVLVGRDSRCSIILKIQAGLLLAPTRDASVAGTGCVAGVTSTKACQLSEAAVQWICGQHGMEGHQQNMEAR